MTNFNFSDFAAPYERFRDQAISGRLDPCQENADEEYVIKFEDPMVIQLKSKNDDEQIVNMNDIEGLNF